MSISDKNFKWLDVAAQISGPDAAEIVSPHYIALKPAFRNNAKGPFSPKIDQFAFILRVDGSVRSWNLPLLSHIDLNKRKKCISIDVHIPERVWRTGHKSLAEHISCAFRKGMEQMIAHLIYSKIEVNAADI